MTRHVTSHRSVTLKPRDRTADVTVLSLAHTTPHHTNKELGHLAIPSYVAPHSPAPFADDEPGSAMREMP